MEALLFLYFVITAVTILYTYDITKHDKSTYVKQVHAHMASIMLFHITIIAVLLTIRPSFLDNIYISILNTSLSIMFSLLFYVTNKEDKRLLYIYNTLYLLFASILMAEIFLYFENTTIAYSFLLIYMMFILDLVFYTKANRKKLLIAYGALTLLFLVTNIESGFSVLLSSMYGLIVIGYMYYDHELLVKKKDDGHHLIDSLKYFLDFEGTIVRNIDKYFLDK